MVKNTPLISLFLPSYVKNLSRTPLSIRFFQHKKCPSVVRLFVRPLSVCRQNRVQSAPVATFFQGYKKTFGSVPSPAVPPSSQTRKKPAESAIYSHSTGIIQPHLTSIKPIIKKTGKNPSKIKPKYKFWYILFYFGISAKIYLINCFSG